MTHPTREVSRSPRSSSAGSTALRILVLSHVPLVRELGEGRVCVELTEEFRKLGHMVETFDCRDAFPGDRPARWHRLFPLRFRAKARDFLRREGGRFDIIDALHGVGPLPKREVGFEGLLVARSAGLYAFYQQNLDYQRITWPDRLPGTRAGQLVARWTQHRAAMACKESLRNADLINVSNEDELMYVTEELGLGHKSVFLPLGVSPEHASALADTAANASERLERKEVVFVGAWSLRKGAADWGAIVRLTRSMVPGVRFRFLGTGVDETSVLADLRLPRDEGLTVVPHYAAPQLPSLLSRSAVGALPSYIEGWPLGVLEQLAAGIPTVAYDVPGPRSMLKDSDYELLCPAGDVERFSRLLARNLTLSTPEYGVLAAQCRAIASKFLWPEIAKATVDRYSRAIRELRDVVGAETWR